MSVIIDNKKSLWFNSIPEADYYNVRVKLTSDDTPWSEIEPQAFEDSFDNADTGETEIELSKITALTQAEDTYDFAISAAESNGQESSFFIIEAQQIDFLLPSAPTVGGIR